MYNQIGNLLDCNYSSFVGSSSPSAGAGASAAGLGVNTAAFGVKVANFGAAAAPIGVAIPCDDAPGGIIIPIIAAIIGSRCHRLGNRKKAEKRDPNAASNTET